MGRKEGGTEREKEKEKERKRWEGVRKREKKRQKSRAKERERGAGVERGGGETGGRMGRGRGLIGIYSPLSSAPSGTHRLRPFPAISVQQVLGAALNLVGPP